MKKGFKYFRGLKFYGISWRRKNCLPIAIINQLVTKLFSTKSCNNMLWNIPNMLKLAFDCQLKVKYFECSISQSAKASVLRFSKRKLCWKSQGAFMGVQWVFVKDYAANCDATAAQTSAGFINTGCEPRTAFLLSPFVSKWCGQARDVWRIIRKFLDSVWSPAKKKKVCNKLERDTGFVLMKGCKSSRRCNEK